MRRTSHLLIASAFVVAAVTPASASIRDGAARPLTVTAAATSGCLQLSRAVAADAEITQGWAPNRRAAHARLLAAADAFAHAIAVHETDHGATDDCALPAAEAAERHIFRRTLAAIVADAQPRTSPMSFREADGALNAAYREVMAVEDPTNLAWGSVDKAGIRAAERAWLAYRDAFIAFAATYDTPGLTEQLAIELTMRRTASLEAFLAD